MTKNKKKINQTKEEVFWMNNDFTDHLQDFEQLEDNALIVDPKLANTIRARARKKHLVAIRLDDEQYSLAQKLALKKDMGLSTLIRAWIKKGILAESK
jgi:hypothetical protein